MKVVILAGGKGKRLEPYTESMPKALVPISGRPILEIVVKQLAKQGFNDVILSVGHLAEQIQDYFGDGKRFGVSIQYSKEDTPLGTAGSLNLVASQLDDTFILMNSDTLSTIDYNKVVKFHREGGGSATIVLKGREVFIDYGVVQLDNKSNIVEWAEKPIIDYTVSTGVYILEPEVLGLVKPNVKYDLPDLIKELVANGKVVKGFIFNDYWMDIGRPEDYERAQRDFERMGDEFDL